MGFDLDTYASRERKRFEGDRLVQRATRFALERFWAPVGSDVMPDDEVAYIGNHLFGGPEGRDAIERVDRHIDRLPGLEGLRLVAPARIRCWLLRLRA